MEKEPKFNIEEIPSRELGRELGLEDKGKIKNVDLAQTLAEAGKVLREMAKDPNLNKDEKRHLLDLVEKSEKEAYRKWVNEHQEELSKKFEERVELLKRTLVSDPEVAQEMASTFHSYLIASEMKGISEDERKKILEEGEKTTENKFRTIAPQHIKKLNEEIDKLYEEIKKKREEYEKIYSKLKQPDRKDHTKKEPVNYLIPKRFDESGKNGYYKWERDVFEKGKFIYYSDDEEVKKFKDDIEQLKEDYQELLPQFQDLVKKEGTSIKSLEDECERLEKEKDSLKKGFFESKNKFKKRKWDLEDNIKKNLSELGYHQRVLENYREWTIKRIEIFLENIPCLLDLLSQMRGLESQEKETREISKSLSLRLEKGPEGLKLKIKKVESEIDLLKNQIKKIDEQIKQLKIEQEWRGDLKNQIEDLQSEINKFNNEIQEKNRLILDLKSEIEKLENF